MNTTLSRLQRRLNAIALDQLRAEAARLAAENDELRTSLASADESLDHWYREAKEMQRQLCAQRRGAPGITRGCHLTVVRA